MGLLGDPLEPARRALADLEESRRNAEGTLAKDLAERMQNEFRENGFSGKLGLDRSISCGVLADACRIFRTRGPYISVEPVCYLALGEAWIRFR